MTASKNVLTNSLGDISTADPQETTAALLAGAAWGGVSAGRFRPLAPRLTALLRCTAGGALMGLGSLLIPGGNDGLLLLGMPLLWPHAWLAFAVMAVTIASWLALAAHMPLRLSRRAP